MHPVLCVLVFSMLSAGDCRAFAYDHSFVQLIDDAVGLLFPPVKVSAYLCHLDEDTAITLSRLMSSHGLIHEIHRDLERFTREPHDAWDHRALYVLDLDCDQAISLLRTANESGFFVAPIRWLLLQDRTILLDNSTENHESLDDAKIFNRMAIYPDSEVILVRKLRQDFAEISSVYRISRYHEVTTEDRGNWTLEEGVRIRDFQPTSRRRANLRSTPLTACLVMSDPDTINHLTDFKYKHIDPITKTNYPWLLHIVHRMNATIEIRTTNTWGYRNENGSWNGMVGMLQSRQADLGGTATFLISQRVGVIDYVQLYTRTKALFVFRQPLLSAVSNIFILPFQRSVWLAIGVFLLLVLGLLWLSSGWEYHRETSKSGSTLAYRHRLNQPRQTVSDNLMVVLAAAAQQGSSYEPYRVPSRIVTLMLLLAALSLYTSYTANIVALLQSTTDSIKTLADLLHSPLKCGTHDIVYNRYYFKSFQDPIRRALVDEKIEPRGKNGSWMTMEEGVRRVKNELFAFHGETGTIYKLMQQTYQEEEKCGITEIDILKVMYPLFAIQPRSPYKEIIKNTALLLGETGLTYREESRLYTAKPKCHGRSSVISIGFTECYFAFLAMGYGSLLSLLVFAVEFLWYKRYARILQRFRSFFQCVLLQMHAVEKRTRRSRRRRSLERKGSDRWRR
ncbi:ionotropic receptor 75a-like [Osmia bicornis bicornis]|uniref:ionotropic receptor 75a-like n=1 Tax=Osmia bicornis bicornis TaxID=1437191 RepID=UPI001EAEF126|nr:ionotropic receptor 75a-like [Osmia bicornis bicornis]